jgi:TnpA family transposase
MVNIRAGWDGFVRLMASVDAGTVSGVLALDRFGSESRADPIHKCGSAMGQLFLTLFLCDFVGKDEFRRELLRILDRGESTHRLLRAIYAGNIPAHRGRRPEELIAISGSLTLLNNITIAWMTLHIQEVTNRWKKEEGRHIDPELLRHIGPSRSEGVNFRGKLDFPVHQYQDRLLSKKARNLGQANL